MTCLQVREELVECWGAEQGLGPDVRAHLIECRECRREAELLRGTRLLLDRVEPAEAPAGFRARVMARVDRTEPERIGWPERAREWLWPRQQGPAWGRALAVAAVLVLLIGGLALLQGLAGPPAAQPQSPALIAAGGGSGAASVFNDEDIEALMLRHQALESNQALSDDPGVHMISYTY